MTLEIDNKLNRLFRFPLPADSLLFSFWLKEKGYSDQSLKSYRDKGWLSVLARRRCTKWEIKFPPSEGWAVIISNWKNIFHIGAHSAIKLWGFNHYVPMGKPVLMIGRLREEFVPEWMYQPDFDMQMKFFSTEIFTDLLVSELEMKGFVFRYPYRN